MEMILGASPHSFSSNSLNFLLRYVLPLPGSPRTKNSTLRGLRDRPGCITTYLPSCTTPPPLGRLTNSPCYYTNMVEPAPYNALWGGGFNSTLLGCSVGGGITTGMFAAFGGVVLGLLSLERLPLWSEWRDWERLRLPESSLDSLSLSRL